MTLFGLHLIDLIIILTYLLGMMYVGKRIAKSVKNETDFYLAGRKLGKLYQFFLMFGGATDAMGPHPGVSQRPTLLVVPPPDADAGGGEAIDK